MTIGLEYCSRLAKTLTAIQERLGYGERTKAYSEAVGQILSWFFFEAFRPLSRNFSELRDLHLQDKEWCPDFVAPADLQSSFSRIRDCADEGDRIGELLRANGLGVGTLEELQRWTQRCREFADLGSAA